MSDHKDDSDDDIEPGFSLSSILFGNVNKDGELIDDFFGKETSKHLKSLDQLNIASGLIEEIKDDVKESLKDANKETEATKKDKVKEKDEEDFEKKLDDAINYSDEDELIEDEDQKQPQKEKEEEDAKFREALSELVFKMPTAPISKPTLQQQTQKKKLEEDDDYDSSDVDKSNNLQQKQQKEATKDKSAQDKTTENKTKTDIIANESDENKLNKKNKLDTPLAEMLPSKYENCDVTEIFPEFRPNKTLRFSRLFGPGKPSLLPNLWKNVKNKKRKKKRQTSESIANKDENSKENKELTNNQLAIINQSSNDRTNALSSTTEFQLKFAETFDENDLEEDQEEILKRPLECKNYLDSEQDINGDLAQKIESWRNGPAAYWYSDQFMPDIGKIFDFSFDRRKKQNESSSEESSTSEVEDSCDNLSNHSLEDCYHMVTQGQWEDEIIWNGEDCKQKILAKNTEKYHTAGWVPSGANRTADSFIKQVRGLNLPAIGQKSNQSNSTSSVSKNIKDANKNKLEVQNDAEKDETWYSMFPAENEELIYGIWEGDVIWDAENLNKIPEPKILTLDPNDENIVLGIPDDIDPSAVKPKQAIPIPLKEKKEHHLKKSRILLGKAGVIAEPEPESPPPQEELEKDPYNISNDEYYNPKLVQNTALKPTVGVNLIQHSIPALELRPIFFPTYMGPIKLRSFHRPPLKRYSHGAVADSLSHPVIPLLKHMKKKAKQREQERLAAGGGDMFFMRTPEDLSGKDGDIILCEYSEEHPPLMMQVGMATKIKNYYKRRLGKDSGAPEFEFGETIYAHTTPFLGNLQPGQSLQAIENNLFRAPIYKHNLPETDFLIIRTRNNYFIRNVETIFTIGQELPLYEVPGPNSKKANNFIRDFLQVFIYRLFWGSIDTPRRIKMEDIKKAFPSHSESSIRKRLKLCADFKRTGMDSNWWVLKPEFRLPTEEEMRAMVSPEQCCSYYSMIAAEQRLKDAGYGEKSLFTADDDNDEDQQLKMDDEVKTAPWNTTRAFIAAMKGKCLLQLNGVADPTGCGEGFSYVRIPNKPQISKEDIIKQQEPKKTVTGTDADLRRLPLSAAKNLLRKHNVPEEEIKKLSRWEVIDVVRTLSTAQAKAGAETMSKFARGNRFSIAEHQERYKEEAQRIFELQNRLLGSAEELSTDEDESEDDEDMDIEEMGKNIENIIANKKTSQQLSLEREEEERRELHKWLNKKDQGSNQNDQQNKQQQANKKSNVNKPTADDFNDDSMNASNQGKLLKIYRTYHNADGKEYIRIETVRKPAIITAYVKLRQTKDPEQIRKFTQALDEQEKEEYRKVKRRLQEQLRRLKRNAEKNKLLEQHQPPQQHREVKLSLSDEPINDIGIGINASSNLYEDPSLSARPIGSGANTNSSFGNLPSDRKSKDKKEAKEKKEPKVKCGACGQSGHMKTNKICPMYTGELPPIQVAMTEQEEQQQKTSTMERDDLIKVDDTKLIFSKALFNYEEEIKKKTLILKVPKDVLKRKRRIIADDYCDYLEKPDYKQANRRRKDPLVSLSIILEQIATEIKQMEGTDIFWLPVNPKKVKDYYNIIKKPMDIQTIKKKISNKDYKGRDEFLADWSQIYENSKLYNGPTHQLTTIAQRMYEQAKQRIEEKSDKVAILERTINPLLDNDQVAFSFILESVVLPRLRNVSESWPFHQPVNSKKVKNYYDRIKNPIDLETILSNAKEHKYHNRQMFLNDIELMYNNSVEYNGKESPLSNKALELLEVARQCIEENDTKIRELESSIVATKEAALDDDSESVATGGLSNPDENSSIADGEHLSRSESRAESAKNEEYYNDNDNASDYYDENSQGGLVINQQQQERNQQEAMQYEQMMIDNEDIVYDNYDPSEFLRERFNQAVMSEDDDSRQTKSQQQAVNRVNEEEIDSRTQNEESKLSATNFEQDFEMSDEDSKMEIDNGVKSNDRQDDEDDDDIWF